MFEKINRWLLEVFSNSDVNKLLTVIALFCGVLWLFIAELAPLLGAVLIAYVLEGAVSKLCRRFDLSRAVSVAIVITLAVLATGAGAYALPYFLLQLRALGDQIPRTGESLELIIAKINELLPQDAALDQSAIAAQGTEMAATALTYLFNNLFSFAGNLFSLFVYLILLPLLVFFLLRDKALLARYLGQFMPQSSIFTDLWEKVDEQFGAYIRGKIIEALFVGNAAWIAFALFKMEYALALSILIGLSVFIPFVGAVAVTFPVVLFAYLQFGWSPTFAWVVVTYTIIQTIDGQLLVPLLFSQVVNIHPVALFSALIFFGNVWGLWGIFFAIPLASLIKCIISVIIERRAATANAP